MIVSLAIILTLAWVKQEVTRDKFEGHAGHRPKISAYIIVETEHDFGATILPCLDLLGEVMMGPATISQITDLE